MKSILTLIARFALCAALLHTAHAEEPVGSLPGQLSVQQGAAVYTIPIEVLLGMVFPVGAVCHYPPQPNHRPEKRKG